MSTSCYFMFLLLLKAEDLFNKDKKIIPSSELLENSSFTNFNEILIQEFWGAGFAAAAVDSTHAITVLK